MQEDLMNTRRPQHCSIKVSGQNPTPEQARDYVYIDKYPEEQMEGGFFEVKTTAAFKTPTSQTAPKPSGSPIVITFSNNISLTLNPGFGGEDLWRCLSILEASHVV